MKYTEAEVLDIIKCATDKDPQEVFTTWVNRKANTLLDLTKHQYNHFVYTFPIKVEGKDVGDITLVDLYHNGSSRDDLMLKYFALYFRYLSLNDIILLFNNKDKYFYII